MSRVDQLLAQACLPGETPRLDAELLLAHCLGRDRVWLRAWPEYEVPPEIGICYCQLLDRRAAGEPMAYLVGQREFWSMSLRVQPGSLIPRPDTECLVERALERLPETPARVLDLGTGTGAIALALASERPDCQVVALDIDPANAALAAANARALTLDNVQVLVGCWLQPLAAEFDLIVSNPPYIAADDPHLQQGDVRFEPLRALVSGSGGLQDLTTIIATALAHLKPQGWLLLEHGWTQRQAVADLLQGAGFEAVQCWQDYAGQDRVSGGRKPPKTGGGHDG